MRFRAIAFPELEGEADWAVALDLFINSRLGRAVCISSACIASGSPPTTALRHLRNLETAGFLVREEDKEDRRRSYLRLAPEADERLRNYLKRFSR